AYCVDADGGSARHEYEGRSAFPQKLFGAVALALIALACGWTLHANLFGTHDQDALPAPAITIVTAQPAAPEAGVTHVPWTAAKKRSLLTAPVFDIALLDSTRALGLPVTFSQSVPLKSTLQAPRVRVVQGVPLPTPRPAEIRNPLLQAMAQRGKAVAATADSPFEKLFGKARERG